MKSCIENLINGNLRDARKQAKRLSQAKLIACMVSEFGWSGKKSFYASSFLKTGDFWQQYCDAE